MRLLRLIRQNLRRNLRHNVLSSIGIIIGIAALSFFLALDAGVRDVVLGEIFPVDRFEVVPPKSTLFGSGRRIDDAVVARLRAPPADVGVKPAAVYPRMKLVFPARGWGGKRLLRRERDLFFELTGFIDGVSGDVVADDVRQPFTFEDFLSPAKGALAKCVGDKNHCSAKDTYCAWDIRQCHRPVPAVLSRHMIELYNSTIATANPQLPRIPDFATSLFAGRMFTVELGRSYLGSRAERGGDPIQRKFRLVGVSRRAIRLGISVPLAYVKRWNRRYAGKAAAESYSSVVVRVSSKRDITALVAYAKRMGFDVAESVGEKIGVFITMATVLFTLVSVIIIVIAAINIAHTYMMLIGERRREIGVLRAVGATRAAIRTVILGEAALVGLLGGGLGLLLGRLAAWGCDYYSATRVPDFPFKPETYFVFSPGLVAAALGFGVAFCLLGALVPAGRAARMQPAEALSMR